MGNGSLILLSFPAMCCAIASAPSVFGQASAGNYLTGFRYDSVGRLTGVISPDPDGVGALGFPATRTVFDASGREIRSEVGELASWQSDQVAPKNWVGFVIFRNTEISYDQYDRKIIEKSFGNGVLSSLTHYSYDGLGRVLCTAIRMDPAQWNSQIDACVPQVAGSNGPDRIVKNVYDAASQLIQIRKAVGTSLDQAYVTYSYTANGNKEYVIDANGNRAKKEYDGFDRQVKWIFPSTTKPSGYNSSTQFSSLATAGGLNMSDYEQYGYDANSNRTSLRKRDGQVIGYSYDALGQITLKDMPSGNDVYYGYDLRGLQTYARFGSAGGEGIISAWDGFGRQTSSINSMGGGSRMLSYQHDAGGNRTQLTFPDGQNFSFEYDGLDRMIRIRENGSTEIASFAYNNKGERSGVGGGFSTGFSYDNISRLAGITHDMASTSQDVIFCMGAMSGSTCAPSYNAAGQVLNRTISNSAYVWNGHVNINRNYAVNGLNQYTVAGSASFTYDPNGNLTSDVGTTYAYDVENRLLSASGTTNATLSWDPMGRLYQTTGSAATRFLYDGDELVGEYDGSGNLLRRYVHGSGNDDPLIWYEGSGLGDRRHLRADHQGSIVAISNGAGSSLGLNSYDEYGIPGTGNIGRFAYTGQIRVPELGMYHYKARIYSPTLGRFLQTDPIGYDDQINLYAYAGNDPFNISDPDGKCGPACVGAVIGGGIELIGQVASSEDRKAWGTAFSQIGRGEFKEAWQSSRSQIGRIAVATATGAVGGQFAGKLLTRGIASDKVRILATSILGASTNATQQVGSNFVDGKPLKQGVGTAVLLGGAIGGRAGAVGRTEAARHLGLGTGNRAAEKAAGAFETTSQLGVRGGQSVIDNMKAPSAPADNDLKTACHSEAFQMVC